MHNTLVYKCQESESEDGLPQATGDREKHRDGKRKDPRVAEQLDFESHLLLDVKHDVSLFFSSRLAWAPNHTAAGQPWHAGEGDAIHHVSGVYCGNASSHSRHF